MIGVFEIHNIYTPALVDQLRGSYPAYYEHLQPTFFSFEKGKNNSKAHIFAL